MSVPSERTNTFPVNPNQPTETPISANSGASRHHTSRTYLNVALEAREEKLAARAERNAQPSQCDKCGTVMTDQRLSRAVCTNSECVYGDAPNNITLWSGTFSSFDAGKNAKEKK